MACPNPIEHGPHEWYGIPAVFRQSCCGHFEDSRDPAQVRMDDLAEDRAEERARARASAAHQPTINRFPYFSTPFIYWVYCSCGEYANRSKFIVDLDAWKAWLDHARSRGAL